MKLSGLRRMWQPVLSAWYRGVTWRVYDVDDLAKALVVAHVQCGAEGELS